jgi:hypothetical protein
MVVGGRDKRDKKRHLTVRLTVERQYRFKIPAQDPGTLSDEQGKIPQYNTARPGYSYNE